MSTRQPQSFWLLLLSFLAGTALPPVLGQSAEPVSVGDRLALYEKIFREQSRLRSLPLLRDRLKQVALELASTPNEELQAESRWLAQRIAEGGVVDLVELAKAISPDSAWPEPVVFEDEGRGVWDLTPQVALEINPKPAASAVPQSLAIQQIQWRLDRLQAGNYEVLLNYATLREDAKFTLQCALGSSKFERQFSTPEATSSPKSYRLLRLGEVKIEQAIESAQFAMRVTEQKEGEPLVLVLRHLILRRMP